jgi:ABC-type Mn2+/Zn2+ transport system permease subunit
MLAWLTDPFGSPIVVRALAEVLILALACGPLGVWVLLYRDAYAAESISHGMLPGLVVAALIGAPLVLGALGGVLLAAAGIALVAADRRLSGDVGVAVCVSALLGLGAMLALSADAPPRLQELLFGDLLGVGAGDLLIAGALAGGVVLALAGGHRRLALVGFDRGSAGALGAAPARWELAPAAAALSLTRRLLPALVLAVGFGALSGLGGLIASYHFEIAAGASVALCAVACAGFALLVGRNG